MYATAVLASLIALCGATPYYNPYAQQRQLFYPVVPQYPQYQQYPAISPYRQVYYAPPTAANLVASVPSAVRYASPLAAPAKQVLYYPGALPYPGNVVFADENAEAENGGWTSIFSNFISNFPSWGLGQSPVPGSPAAGAEGGSGAAPAGEGAAAPTKIEAASPNSEEPSKESENKENESEKQKPEVKGKLAPQKYVLVGQPQFFGNLGLQRNPAAVLPSANHGAVSSYLLFKNYPGFRFGPQVPGQLVPQVQPQIPQADTRDAELIPAGQPGAAAIEYQQLLQAAQQARQLKEYEDSASVTVDAKDSTENDKPATENESEGDKESEDEESGPTIAQAKPKAVALAGPGGVAAAAPVGTALVGPGGMAISAPEATAVAGVKGANSSGVVSPGTTKLATKALKTYHLARQNLNYFLSL